MLIVAMLVAGAQAAPATGPASAAEALGRRVAAAGTLGTLLPLMAAKEADELIAQHPDLSPADRAALHRTADATLAAAEDRLFAAEGKAYAARLSRRELRAIVRWQESAPARRLRAAQPAAIKAAMAVLDGFDFKRSVWAAWCAGAAGRCPAG